MVKKRSSVYETMRGGQIVFHYIRMTLQILKKNLMWFSVGIILATIFFTHLVATDDAIGYGFKYIVADIKTNYLFGEEDQTTVTLSDGKELTTTWGNIYESDRMRGHYKQLKNRFLQCFFGAIAATFLLMVIWFWYLGKVGRSETDDDHIRGAKMGSLEAHRRRVKQKEKEGGEPSRYSIAGVPVPPKSDRTGFGLVGRPGVGKSATFLDFLAQQRELGDKNFVLDVNGEFTRKFYREGIDIILSPKDSRSHYWDVWSEGANPSSYNTTTSSLIPDMKGNDFFAQAARFVVEAVAEKIANQARASGEQPSLRKLVNYIIRVDNETLIDMIRHSDAKSILDKDSEKTTHSIRSTLTTYTRLLAQLPNEGTRFSFRDWLTSDNDAWVFVPISPMDRAYFKPILSMWMEHFTARVLSLPPNQFGDRRFNLHCDELPSYNKIPSLEMFLAEARKNGGCGFLGFQNKAQIRKIYGPDGSDNIEDLIATYCIFGANGTAGSEWSSKILMEAEVNKTSENLSMGSNEVRDSVGLNKGAKDHRLVKPSEIINMEDMEVYLRFGRGYDLLKTKQTYPQLPDVAEPLIMPSDEELANRSFIAHHEQYKGKNNAAPASPNVTDTIPDGAPRSPNALTGESDAYDNDVPPDYEAFAAALDAKPAPASGPAEGNTSESETAAQSNDKDDSNDPFVRGF